MKKLIHLVGNKKSFVFKSNILYGLIIFLIILVTYFSLNVEGFLSISNFNNIIKQSMPLALIVLGTSLLIISGNIDLSSGSFLCLNSIIFALSFQKTNNFYLSFFTIIIFAICLGFSNAFFVAYLNFHSAIVTIAAMIWSRGLATTFTRARTIPADVAFLNMLSESNFINLPISFFCVLLIYLLFWIFIYKIKIGIYIFAIGGNEEASKQAGINVRIIKILLFCLQGFLVGIASLIAIGRTGAVQPATFGLGLELDAISASVIGGNSLNGGRGGIPQAIMGFLVIVILRNGLSMMAIRDVYSDIITGIILILALLGDKIIYSNKNI